MNNITALFGTLLILYIPVKTFNIISKTWDLKDSDFQQRYRIIIMDLRTDSPLRFQFTSVFFFRRAIYASAFILAVNNSFVQIGITLSTVLAMATYLLIVIPYKTVLSSFLSVVNEFLLMCTVAIPGRFLEPIVTPSDSKAFGNTLIGIVIATIAINWVSIIVVGVITCKHQKYKKR